MSDLMTELIMIDKKTLDRFLDKVHVLDTFGCWEWTASCHRTGYGQFRNHEGKMVQAHRFAYEHLGGNDPPGDLCVCHRCDNPKCQNPEHMFLGTQIDNLADMRSKNRRATGESAGGAKLTDEKVRSIRQLYAQPDGPNQKELAKKHGITQTLVSQIVLRKIWRHVA